MVRKIGMQAQQDFPPNILGEFQPFLLQMLIDKGTRLGSLALLFQRWIHFQRNRGGNDFYHIAIVENIRRSHALFVHHGPLTVFAQF